MGYEHLSTTPETKSNEVTESNAENLLQIPSKCEVTLEDEIECNMPAKDVCSPVFTTFSNPLFKDNENFDSSDDESLPDKDVPAEEFKIYSNSLFDEDEINSDKLNPHCFNVESDFVESLLNRDTFIDFSSKFDFSGELAHIKPEIPKSDFDFEEEIRLIENLLYDNLFPRLPEELNAEIADTIIESIPLLPIPVQDGNSQQEEIDIVTETDDVMPLSVENDDDDYDLLLGEADLFLYDNSIPPSIENPDMIAEEISDKLNEDKCFDPGREINVSTKIEDDDYFPFMFVIRFFLPYLIFPEMVAISKLIVIDSSTIMEETHHRWRFWTLPLSLRTTEYRDRVEPTTQIIPRRLKTSCVGYCPGFQVLHLNIEDNVYLLVWDGVYITDI
nr:hypothetical protein [Tanacetum cinerariifolium]